MSTLGPYRQSRARLGGERQLRQFVDHSPEGRIRSGGWLGVPCVYVEAGRMAHQLPHRHRLDLRHLAVRCRHLEAGELRDVLGHRVIERPLALLPEHHHGHAHDRFGHRREAEDRVLRDRFLCLQILDAVGVEVHDLAVSRDERRDTGELAVIHQPAHRPLELLQPVGRETDRLRGGKRTVRPRTCRAPDESDHHQRQHRPSSKSLHFELLVSRGGS